MAESRNGKVWCLLFYSQPFGTEYRGRVYVYLLKFFSNFSICYSFVSCSWFFKSHRPQVCSFLSVEFIRTAYRLDVFEFLTKFNTVNWVRFKSPIFNCAVCLPVEKCLLYVCHLSNSKKVSISGFGIDARQQWGIQNFKLNTNIKTVCSTSLEWKTFNQFKIECKKSNFWILRFFYVRKKRARLWPVTLLKEMRAYLFTPERWTI